MLFITKWRIRIIVSKARKEIVILYKVEGGLYTCQRSHERHSFTLSFFRRRSLHFSFLYVQQSFFFPLSIRSFFMNRLRKLPGHNEFVVLEAEQHGGRGRRWNVRVPFHATTVWVGDSTTGPLETKAPWEWFRPIQTSCSKWEFYSPISI